MGLSIGHLVLLLVIVLVVFGAGKLPQIMGDLAKGMRAFKKGMNDDDGFPSSPTSSPSANASHPSPIIIDHEDSDAVPLHKKTKG